MNEDELCPGASSGGIFGGRLLAQMDLAGVSDGNAGAASAVDSRTPPNAGILSGSGARTAMTNAVSTPGIHACTRRWA